MSRRVGVSRSAVALALLGLPMLAAAQFGAGYGPPLVTVPPPRVLPQGGLPTPALPAAAPLLTVTACDATGCLASDGTRLQWVGPSLLGPRGMCTVQGTVLQCP